MAPPISAVAHAVEPADIWSDRVGKADQASDINQKVKAALPTLRARDQPTRFLGTSRNGRSLSVRGSLGISSTRSAMMLR